MSNDKSWNSIVTNFKHPLHKELSSKYDELFIRNQHIVEDWMKGKINTNHIVENLNISIDDKMFRKVDNYLINKFNKDCLNMTVNDKIIDLFLKFVS
ncbi:hypothetical protein FACS1894181_09090 [Bacteroidia bacterium]|nr:hypothetical protein FACS1894181_09090 [Bacteroidia bacterium]